MSQNKRIAFKPHKTRGKEIIRILEYLGASNIRGLDATWRSEESEKLAYYITHFGTIGYNPLYFVKQLGYEIYTLEEYESMNKEKNNQELLLGLVSVENKGQELIPHKDYEIKQDGEKFYLVKKKPKYPKTYEECCEIVKVGKEHTIEGTTIRINYKIALLESFQKLLICRDAYWKIAGEEIGLGKPWKPDWYGGSLYLFYYNPQRDEFVKVHYSLGGSASSAFVFPTEEMRDAFYDNFKELIAPCKELL